jgi:hypothetical protein
MSFPSSSCFLFLWILRKKPHLMDQSAFYSCKLKTEPVKIAFLVDIAGDAMAGAEARPSSVHASLAPNTPKQCK